MNRANLSYAEAYTSFLKYYSDKHRKSIETIISEFRENGIEEDFRLYFSSKKRFTNAEYYKRIRNKG